MSRHILSVFAGNLGSKALALLREVLFAAWFGTGQTAAAFRIAQTLYLLPVQALLGDALSAGLLPLYRQVRGESADAARRLVLWAALYALVFSAVVAGGFYAFADELTRLVAPGADESARALAAALLRILALSTPFYVLGGMLGYIEAAFGRFSGIAWRPMAINLGSIAGAALAVWSGHDAWLAIGLVIAHVLLFGWTLHAVLRLDRLRPESAAAPGLARSLVRRLAANTVPLLGLPLAAQVNVVVERIVSSWLGTAIIPSVDYARFLTDTMVQLIAVPLGLLTMASHGGVRDDARADDHLRRTAALVFCLAFPIALFLSFHAETLVRLLFARGAFDEASVQTTSAVLRWMGAGLVANIPAYYLVKGLNAQLRNREALTAIVLGCAANMAVNLALWRWAGPATVGIGVMAYGACVLAYSMSRLGLWRSQRALLGWMAGLTGVGGLGLLALGPLPALAQLALGAAWLGACGLAAAHLAAPVGEALAPLLRRLPAVLQPRRRAG